MFIFFLDEVNSFLTGCFGELKKYTDWKELYIYLASRVAKANSSVQLDEEKPVTQIDGDVAVPQPGDIVGVCRVLFQSLVSPRVCIPDGQHRMLALLCTLLGFAVKEDSDKEPMRFFERSATSDNMLFSDDIEERTKAFETYTSIAYAQSMVSVCVPGSRFEFNKKNFENLSQELSALREESSNSKLDYNIMDV